jgi:hypothetical protein
MALRRANVCIDGGLNTYAHVGGNPVSRFDQNGLQAQGAAVACGPFALACAAGLTIAGAGIYSRARGGQRDLRNNVNKFKEFCQKMTKILAINFWKKSVIYRLKSPLEKRLS